MAVDPRVLFREPRVLRFGVTERRLHTVHAAVARWIAFMSGRSETICATNGR